MNCRNCGKALTYDRGVLVDPSGGDVCGYAGGNEPHELSDRDADLQSNRPLGERYQPPIPTGGMA